MGLPGQVQESSDGFAQLIDKDGNIKWTYYVRGSLYDSVVTAVAHKTSDTITLFGIQDAELLYGSYPTKAKSFYVQLDAATGKELKAPLNIPTIATYEAAIIISQDSQGVVYINSAVMGSGKNKSLTYKQVGAYQDAFGVTLECGSSSNNVTADGIAGDSTKLSVGIQVVINGSLGGDNIVGSSNSSSRNWLIGGGIYAPGTEPSKGTSLVDRLTGNVGGLDVFDLRTSDFTQDAYSRPNSGTAVIQGYTPGEDYIVLAGSGYSVNQTTTKVGKGTSATIQYGFDILSGSKVVAKVSSASFNALSTASDLTVITGDSSQLNQLGPTQLGLPTFDATGTFVSAPIQFYG